MSAFLKKYWKGIAVVCAGAAAMVGTIHSSNPLVADAVAVSVAVLAWLSRSPVAPSLPEVEAEVEKDAVKGVGL